MALIRPQYSLIFLAGFMASGKTATGLRLAETLGFKYFDLDSEIERQVGKSISQIFHDDGAVFFRQLEYEILKQLVQQKFAVISLGSGTIVEQENIQLLRKTGVIVCLKAEIDELWMRISDTDKQRLIVDDKLFNEEQIYRLIKFLLEVREPYYNQADIFIDTTQKTIAEVVNEIVIQLELTWTDRK